MQMKTPKQQSTAYTCQIIHELVRHTSKNHQNIVGTQVKHENTKNANEHAKATR